MNDATTGKQGRCSLESSFSIDPAVLCLQQTSQSRNADTHLYNGIPVIHKDQTDGNIQIPVEIPVDKQNVITYPGHSVIPPLKGMRF